MTTVRLPRGARAYVTLTIGSDVALTAPPEYAIVAPGAYPLAAGWTAGTWLAPETLVDAEHRRDLAVLLAGPDAPAGDAVVIPDDRKLFARVSDTPEILPTDAVDVRLV